MLTLENGFITRSLLTQLVKYESIIYLVSNWVKNWIKPSKPVSLRIVLKYGLFETDWDRLV